MIAIIITIALATLASIFVGGQQRNAIDDNAAASTGRYLLQVRGAVIDLQLKHQSWIRDDPLIAGDAAPTGLTWTRAQGAHVARGSVTDLVNLGLLPATTPRFPILGDAARFMLVRQGTCPGADCRTTAFVYTCHPINAARSRRVAGDCATPTSDRARFSPSLLAKVLLATDGYAGHDARGGTQVTGALLNAPRTWFDFSPQPGHAVLAAGLDATPFGQFVRHGETRPVTLHNTLTVDQTIQSNQGLLLNTSVIPGAACSPEGLYASTANKMLAVCVSGAWFAAASHLVTGVFENLPNNATVPALACPPGLTPWRHVALQRLGVTVTGADVNVAGTVNGTIQGSGDVNAAGAVAVKGTFAGTFQNAGASYVRVTQGATLANDRIVITPAEVSARAGVIQGCKG